MEKLKQLVVELAEIKLLRQEPNEMYSSETMDKMIDEKKNEIVDIICNGSVLPILELKDLLSETSQLIAGWNATESEWSKWDAEVKEKLNQLQSKINDKKSIFFC